MADTTAVTTTNTAVAVNPVMGVAEFREHFQAIKALIRDQMRDGVDYGVIPGTGKKVKGSDGTWSEEGKKALLQPGAEKLIKMFGLVPRFSLLSETVDVETGYIRKRYKCELVHFETQKFAGEAIRVCSSYEKKYLVNNVNEKWATEEQKKRSTGSFTKKGDKYTDTMLIVRKDRIELLETENTIEGMAQKRAMVAAARTATMATEIFADDPRDPDVPGAYDVDGVATGEMPAPKTPTSYPSTDYRKSLLKDIFVIAGERGFDQDKVKATAYSKYRVESMTQLSNEQLEAYTELFVANYAPVEPGHAPRSLKTQEEMVAGAPQVVEGEIVGDEPLPDDPLAQNTAYAAAQAVFPDAEVVAGSDVGRKGGAKIRDCSQCGAQFDAAETGSAFCSPDCKTAYWDGHPQPKTADLQSRIDSRKKAGQQEIL